jgi:hypothetical protein
LEAIGFWIQIGATSIANLKTAHKTIGRALFLLLFLIHCASTVVGTIAKAPEEFFKPEWATDEMNGGDF